MPGPLVYVDTSRVHEGALDQLRAAIDELAAFIESNEPQLLGYAISLSDDATEMAVVHVHADTASLEHHLELGGPAFRRFADLLTLTAIHVYGEPSEKAVELMREKARMLGVGEVIVHRPRAGFTRLARPPGE